MSTWNENVIGNANNANTRTNATGLSNYNQAMNYLNDWNQQNTDNWNNVGDSRVQVERHKKHTKGGHHKTSTDYDEYINANTGYNVLDDYSKGTSKMGANYSIGNSSWDKYYKDSGNTFNNLYNTTSNNLFDQAQNTYTGMYNPYDTNSNFSTLVGNKDTAQYNDALGTLQRDLARGYLSQGGYDTALNKLNNQQAVNQQNLKDLGSAQYNNWNNDLKQTWTGGLDDLNGDSWIKYYNNWNNYNGANMNQLFDKSQGLVSDYANAYINDDLFNNAIDTSLYTPDQYAANGAESQGLFNPFNRNAAGRRRRITLDNIGEY